jgi:putative restriction endonuclease
VDSGLGITDERRICVSGLYVARSEAGRAVDALAGKPLFIPRPHQPTVDVIHISWHHQQVFKGVIGTESQIVRLGCP